jgi:hypothetical protein
MRAWPAIGGGWRQEGAGGRRTAAGRGDARAGGGIRRRQRRCELIFFCNWRHGVGDAPAARLLFELWRVSVQAFLHSVSGSVPTLESKVVLNQ